MKTFYSHLDESGRGGASYLFTHDYGLKEVQNPENADIIIWNGGEDIATSIYNEQPIGQYIPRLPTMRDAAEIAMFDKFSKNPTKMLFGICRGAQLLNCLNGGKLYQDVNGHGGSHRYLDLKSGEELMITSTHHQMMRPGPDGVVIGVSSQSTYKNSGSDGVQHFKPTKDLSKGEDVETVWYPKTHTLCMQGHPEYVPNSKYSLYTWNLLNECYSSIKLQKAIRA